MERYRFPSAREGQKIGLLGGSFDPAHAGHIHLSKQALMRFDLDQIWWLVTPGNPLKTDGPNPLEQRVAYANKLVDDPRIVVSGVEEILGTYYTVDTLKALQSLFRFVNFTWIMGADNLAQFHLWKDWQQIMHMMPIGVLARPGSRMAARRSVAARMFDSHQLASTNARNLPQMRPPAWCFANMPMSGESSTAIRQRGAWPSGVRKPR